MLLMYDVHFDAFYMRRHTLRDRKRMTAAKYWVLSTKPMSRHFYRGLFLGVFPAKKVLSGLHEGATVRKEMDYLRSGVNHSSEKLWRQLKFKSMLVIGHWRFRVWTRGKIKLKRLVSEKAVTGIWGTCVLFVMGSWFLWLECLFYCINVSHIITKPIKWKPLRTIWRMRRIKCRNIYKWGFEYTSRQSLIYCPLSRGLVAGTRFGERCRFGRL